MKYSLFLGLLFLQIITFSVDAHQDFWVRNDFGKVHVEFYTGFQYEEINKSIIIGQLAEKLCVELKYDKHVFLTFNHYYVEHMPIEYSIIKKDGYFENEKHVKKKNIQIKQRAKEFDILNTLKILEYAINNEESIKKIDSLIIMEIINSPPSDLVIELSKTKIYRPDKDFYSGINYYWQNNRYTVYVKSDKKEEVLLKLEKIYDFKVLETYACFVFTSDTTFQFVSGPFVRPKFLSFVSREHKIEGAGNYYRPFNVKNLKDGYYAIPIEIHKPNYREWSVIYSVKEDKVYQSLQDEFNKRK